MSSAAHVRDVAPNDAEQFAPVARWGGGAGYFGYGHIENHAPELDSFVTSAATALAVPPQDVPTVEGQVPLKAPEVGLSGQSYLQRALPPAQTTWPPKGLP